MKFLRTDLDFKNTKKDYYFLLLKIMNLYVRFISGIEKIKKILKQNTRMDWF